MKFTLNVCINTFLIDWINIVVIMVYKPWQCLWNEYIYLGSGCDLNQLEHTIAPLFYNPLFQDHQGYKSTYSNLVPNMNFVYYWAYILRPVCAI